MELSWPSYLLGGTAALLVGVSKTGIPGAAVLAVASMALAFPQDAKLSVGVLLPLLLVGDLFALAYYRRHAQWSRLVRLLPCVLLGMIPAVVALSLAEQNQLRPLLGSLVLALLAAELCRRRLGWHRLAGRWWFTAVAGTLAGFGTMVGNAAGPVMSIYLVSQGMQKEQFLGTCAWFFFLVNLLKLPVYAWQAMITPVTLRVDLRVAVFVVAGALVGVKILPKIPQRLFDALVLILALAAGLRLAMH